MRFGPANAVSKYRYKLMAPYVLVFFALGAVGLQLTNLSSAETLPDGAVEISVANPNYKLGDIVKFTISNQTQSSVFIANNCPGEPLEVYRQEAGQWQQIQASADASKCGNEPRSYEIATKATVSATYRYWPELFDKPGRYRLVAPLEGYDTTPSVEFTIQ